MPTGAWTALDGVALPVSGAPRRRGPPWTRPEADPAPSTPAQVGALSALDSAGLFGGLAQERLVDQEGFDMSTDRVGGLG